MMPPFYTTYVQLPNSNSPMPPKIWDEPKFYPFFDCTLGTIDGTHIACFLSTKDCNTSRNCKGTLTQNCLITCSFDLHFIYILSSWEGSTHDSTLYNDACQCDSTSQGGGITLQMLVLPPQMCFLSLIEVCGTICLNGGMATISKKFLLLFIFSLTLSFVVSPHDTKELFNLHHTSACNVIEQIFGILKWHFWILCNPPEYNMAI